MLFHMIVERFDVSEHFQKQVVPIHQNLPMDVDPLIPHEDRLFLGLLPVPLLNEPSGPLPYVDRLAGALAKGAIRLRVTQRLSSDPRLYI